jgi:hypothetical protein
MAWVESYLKGGGGSQTPTRLWLMNPDYADAMASASITRTLIAYFPYVTKIKANENAPVVFGTTSFGGANKACAYRSGRQVSTTYCGIKIPHGVYSKLYVECQVTADGTGWLQARLALTSNLNFTYDAAPASILKGIILVSDSSTSADINAQTGVVINSTDPLLLSAQTVEVDVSDISSDFYFAFWNCDRKIAIRSIYLE